MRNFCFVLLALLCLVVPVSTAQACNGVAVQLQANSFILPLHVNGFIIPAPVTFVQQPPTVVFLRQQAFFRPAVTEVRQFTGPLGLFSRTVIRQR